VKELASVEFAHSQYIAANKLELYLSPKEPQLLSNQATSGALDRMGEGTSLVEMSMKKLPRCRGSFSLGVFDGLILRGPSCNVAHTTTGTL
jgi:hypothetical protein